jgi:transposase
LQDVVARVEKTFDRWLKGDSNGKRSGKPRFKGQGRYRSVAFPDPVTPEHIKGNLIQLPKIGNLKVILHRPIPDGFKVKTSAIVRRADGYYITLSLQDSSVPELTPEVSTLDNTIGIDMGLKSFLVDDSGAENAGLMTIAVNPNGTTQECSGCGQKVPKTIQDRWHECQCGCSLDRDHNAAKNIKHRAVGHPVFKAQEAAHRL